MTLAAARVHIADKMTEHAPTDHHELQEWVDRLYAAHDLGVFAVFNAMCAEIEAEQITEVDQ